MVIRVTERDEDEGEEKDEAYQREMKLRGKRKAQRNDGCEMEMMHE